MCAHWKFRLLDGPRTTPGTSVWDPADIPDEVPMVSQERVYTSPIWYNALDQQPAGTDTRIPKALA